MSEPQMTKEQLDEFKKTHELVTYSGTRKFCLLQREIDDLIALAREGLRLREDGEFIDWLQKGHCVLCLCKFNENKNPGGEFENLGYEFEIDGYHDCPRGENLREVLREAIKRPPEICPV